MRPQGSSEVAKAHAERRVGLYVLASALLVGGTLRVWLAFNDDGISYPDEIHQSLEPAHRLVFGYGLVAWEFVEGARNWLFPGTIAALLELCRLIGLDDPRVYLGLTRVTFAAIGIATALGSYWLARGYGAGTLPAACGAAIFALAGPMIYFAPRAMSETASALAVVLGFALSLPRDAGSVRRVVGVSMLGVSVLMRLQNGIFCLGLLAILAGRRDIRGGAAASLVLGVWAVAFGLLDWVTWGGWFHSAFAYLEHNLGPEPERFGTAPFEYYASVLSTAMAAPTAFLAVLSVAGVVRAPGLFSVAVLVVLAYSAVPHKEFRFIFPALPLFCALAGIGLDQIGKTAQKRMSIEPPVNLKWVTPTLAVCVLVSAALSAATFHALTFRDLGQLDPRLSDASAYDSGGDINRLLILAGRRGDVCGLKIEVASLDMTGGYSYLHRRVPLYPYSGPSRESGYFNYVIAIRGPDTTEEVVASDGRLALARTRDRCVADVGYDWMLHPLSR